MLMAQLSSPAPEPPPFLSVVVPTHGRPGQLVVLLRAMVQQTYPADHYELIVVDDGGPEGGLEAVAGPFRTSLPLTLLRQDKGGPGAARNTGAARARGRCLVFTADDCQPAPDWLAALDRRLRVNPGTMVGGRVVNGLPDDMFATTTSLLIDYLDRCRDSQTTDAPFYTPNNLAVPADMFHRVGGFDASMGATGEDRDFCDRWLAAGLAMTSADEVVVRHVHRQTLRGFWHQHVAYGRGSRKFYRQREVRAYSGQPRRLTPERMSFYWRLVLHPLSRHRGYRGWLQAGLMAVSQVANLVGFVLESRGPRRPRTVNPAGTKSGTST